MAEVLGLAVGIFGIAETAVQVISAIQRGRKWEKIRTELLTEEFLHRDYRSYVLHGQQTPSVDVWINGSVRSSMEMRFGYDKAHHLIKLLEQNENTIRTLKFTIGTYRRNFTVGLPQFQSKELHFMGA